MMGVLGCMCVCDGLGTMTSFIEYRDVSEGARLEMIVIAHDDS